jgi:hypothetical protein
MFAFPYRGRLADFRLCAFEERDNFLPLNIFKERLDCPSLGTLRGHTPMMLYPSLEGSLAWGMASMLVPLRPSSEITDDPSKLARYLSGMRAD